MANGPNGIHASRSPALYGSRVPTYIIGEEQIGAEEILEVKAYGNLPLQIGTVTPPERPPPYYYHSPINSLFPAPGVTVTSPAASGIATDPHRFYDTRPDLR